MKSIFTALMVCTMLLCIPLVSFGSDEGPTNKAPDISIVDLDYHVDVIATPVNAVSVDISTINPDAVEYTTLFKTSNALDNLLNTIVIDDKPVPIGCYALFISNLKLTLNNRSGDPGIPIDLIESNHTGKSNSSIRIKYTPPKIE